MNFPPLPAVAPFFVGCPSAPVPHPNQGPDPRKFKWNPDEDALLRETVERLGVFDWARVAAALPGRTGKQCRERWMNHLSPSINNGVWTPAEDMIIIQQQFIHGNAWATMKPLLPGRSACAIKNRWTWLSRHRLTPLTERRLPLPLPPPRGPSNEVRQNPTPHRPLLPSIGDLFPGNFMREVLPVDPTMKPIGH
jgi:hypothetical protein